MWGKSHGTPGIRESAVAPSKPVPPKNLRVAFFDFWQLYHRLQSLKLLHTYLVKKQVIFRKLKIRGTQTNNNTCAAAQQPRKPGFTKGCNRSIKIIVMNHDNLSILNTVYAQLYGTIGLEF